MQTRLARLIKLARISFIRLLMMTIVLTFPLASLNEQFTLKIDKILFSIDFKVYLLIYK